MEKNVGENNLMTMDNRSHKVFSNFVLKMIAIFAMTIDHVTMLFMPNDTAVNMAIWQILRFIGRITAVVMCYMAADGFHYTKNPKKYLIRLFVCAIVSHFPYAFMHSGDFFFVADGKFQTSIIWPIFLGVLSLYINKYTNWKKIWKALVIIGLMILAIPSDWNVIAMLFIISGELLRECPKKKWWTFFAIAGLSGTIAIIIALINKQPFYTNIFQWGMFLGYAVLMMGNGEKGYTSFWTKWIFYVYYPIHMLILGLIYMYTIGF